MEPAFTLHNALDVAKTLLKHRVADFPRLQRGYEIVMHHNTDIGGLYAIEPRGTHIATRRCYYAVTKFDKGGKVEQVYYINLSNALACDCPDVRESGVITCKHAYACMLYQMMQDIYVDHMKGV